MGKEISEGEMQKMQSMMSDMKPEDMEKWAGRAQTVAKVAVLGKIHHGRHFTLIDPTLRPGRGKGDQSFGASDHIMLKCDRRLCR